MKQSDVFCVLGGDLRQYRVARSLAEKGYKVKLFGFSEYTTGSDGTERCSNIEDALNGTKYIILPLPYSVDGISLNAPYMKSSISMNEIYKRITPEMTVFGGKFSSHELSERGVKIVDYFDREELQVLNAVPTAEGAIQIAMQERAFTIHGSKCLVVGFGRIGKVLAEMLKGLNAKVSVSARKYSDFAWIRTHGFTPIKTDKLTEHIADYDIVFNTVPAIVIGKEELSAAKQDTLFIDLASKPGGIDFEQAKACGVDTIWLLSLPGKVAPITAGEIITETILNILETED